MGDGLTVQGNSVWKGMGLSPQNLEVVADFLPLELGGSNMVLDMQWLETLGTMQVNYQLLHMKFNVGGIAITLQGDPSLSKTRVSLKAMCRTMQQEGDVTGLTQGYVSNDATRGRCYGSHSRLCVERCNKRAMLFSWNFATPRLFHQLSSNRSPPLSAT
ncbi:hypothetical protein PanWU01x14_200990 [Parasponia andersonii]|uniref:Uncharacterized protein n=1 Tax=Parasponia andersonii TaxID=3476 RepID=A0A2P5BY03_PARAD|nr:hypothetical protein PanWU01x14_200990 [Parasponia andersonii]